MLPVLLLVLIAVSAQAQSTTEIIRGRVFRTDSTPVRDADVTVTGLVTQAVLQTRTRHDGSYTVLFTNPESDYLITVRSIGYAPTSGRLTRVGISSILIANFYLTSTAPLLDTITVLARRLTPTGELGSVGGLEFNALLASLFQIDPSDLLSLVLNLPGIVATSDSSFSVMGAASSQNSSTIEGATFTGTNIARDAQSSVKVIASSADPARGGFAGGSVSAGLRGGSDLFAATMRSSLANRTLAWADPDWPQPVPRISGLSGSLAGPFRKRKSHYLVAWDMRDVASEWYSLLTPKASLLAQQGILLDTVTALSATLGQLGIPLAGGSIPASGDQKMYTFTTVLDFAPSATTSLRISHNGSWATGSGGTGVVPINAYPSRANDEYGNYQFISTKLSGYLHGMLDELTTSFNYNTSRSAAFSNLPAGAVRVGTQFDDGRTGLTTLLFGGGKDGHRTTAYYVEAANELSWIPKNSAHRVKFGQRLAYDHNNNLSWQGNLNGNYTYQTLTDLTANRPAQFDRLLTTFARESHSTNTSFWIGDEWATSKALQFQGGLRLDFAHPGTRPEYNPAIDQLFGLRTDRIPNDVGMSPRLGFSWASKARRGIGTPGGSASLGGLSAASIRNLPPELVMMMMGGQRTTTLPGISVTGTIGGYRGVTSTAAIAALVDRTGLPGTLTELTCVGGAVPIPNWGTIGGNPPASCADGTPPGVFSFDQPTVQVYDPAYRAPVSWRANVGVDGIRVVGKWILGVTGAYSINAQGQSSLDQNLNRTPGFALTSEANRPVFLPPTAIIPETGVSAPGASRIVPQYGVVGNTISDLSGYNAQLQATLIPPRPIFHSKVNLSLTYTLARGAQDVRGSGFSSAGTAGDPFLKERVPSSIPTHQVRLTGTVRAWWFNLSISALAQSGIPFTPLVRGDINGDGNATNDRAFIPNPATTPDPELATQMRTLLTSAPSGASDCITSQFGQMAGANTCHTPWQARLDLNLNFQPPSSWGFGDRLHATANMLNASGALVRIFGLQNTLLGQSSLSTYPNATLFYVTGFDPAAQRFTYQVNQLFGEPTNFGSARHRFPPFQLQFGLEYKLGGPPTNPMSRSTGMLAQEKQPPLSESQLRVAVTRLKQNPVDPILQRKDSLGLTSAQVAQLQSISAGFNASADSAIAPVIDYVLKKRNHVTDAELGPKLSTARSALAKLNQQAVIRVQGVLTPEQARKIAKPAPPGGATAATGRGGSPPE